MEGLFSIITIVMVAINISFMVASLKGIKFKENDVNCLEEVAEVKHNKQMIKAIASIDAILSIILLIISIIKFG